MNGPPPRCIVLGGVNGAGKTTSARSILADTPLEIAYGDGEENETVLNPAAWLRMKQEGTP